MFNRTGLYRYTDHLMAYESLPPQWDHIDPHLLPITTPLHVGIWEQCLASHPDKQFAQYIVQGLHKGFRIGFDASSPLKAASRNMPSTSEQHDIVSKYLQEEIAEGRILGPFTPGELNTPIHISPIGVIPKRHQPNKWRLIVDMSSPDGFSINQYRAILPNVYQDPRCHPANSSTGPRCRTCQN